MKVIFSVMKTTVAVVKIKPEKVLLCMGFEPMTSAISVQCSTNTCSQSLIHHFAGLLRTNIRPAPS